MELPSGTELQDSHDVGRPEVESEREREMVIRELEEELTQNVDEEYADAVRRYDREAKALFGVRTAAVRRISARYFSKVKKKPKEEVLDLCESLLDKGYREMRTIAFDWAFRLKKQYSPSDFHTFETWLKTYVKGWGSCDDLCTHAFGELLFQFPDLIPKVKVWATSENRWLRRASAVILIYSIRRDAHTEVSFEIADILLTDQEDLVQKGYGWMLKEVSNVHPQEVFDYVIAHKGVMPRTSLRYAIENLSRELRKKAMAKD